MKNIFFCIEKEIEKEKILIAEKIYKFELNQFSIDSEFFLRFVK